MRNRDSKFVSFEMAKMLKDLKYNYTKDDYPQKGWYRRSDEEMENCTSIADEVLIDNVYIQKKSQSYPRPMWQQVKYWLWEKSKIRIQVTFSIISKSYVIKILQNVEIFENEIIKNIFTTYDSPIVAEIDAIAKAVEHLHCNFLKK